MQNLQIPETADSSESKVPQAWMFAIKHIRRDRLTFRPDAIKVTPKKTCKIIHIINRAIPMIKALLGRRVVLGRGQGSLAAATAAGGKTPYQPQLTGLDRLAPRTSLGSVVQTITSSFIWKSNLICQGDKPGGWSFCHGSHLS